MKLKMKSKLGFVTVISVAVLTVGVLVAQAAGETPVPRTIHYEGYLEKDDNPYSTALTVPMRAVFTLHRGATAGGETYRYPRAPDTLPLSVSAGQFSADIGAANACCAVDALPDWVFDDAANLYLSVQLDGVDLAGLQKIHAVPFAVRAQEATDFRVKGDLATSGAVSSLSVAATDITATNLLSGAGLDISIGGDAGIEVRSTDGGKLAYIDLSNDATTDFDARIVLTADDEVQVQKARLVVPGGIQVGANSNVPHDCHWVETTSSDSTNRARAFCSSNEIVMGGACRLNSNADNVYLRSSYPLAENEAWAASWVCDFSAGAANVSKTALVNCCSL